VKYIVYRGIRHRNKEEYEYEKGKMELTLTILSWADSYMGRYCAHISQKKKPSPKQIEKIWKNNVGTLFENTLGNSLHSFHTDIFCSPSWEEREKHIAEFEEYNEVEKILPGHYEF
jgi:hypothetical protein